jgi:hypothetical protein
MRGDVISSSLMVLLWLTSPLEISFDHFFDLSYSHHYISGGVQREIASYPWVIGSCKSAMGGGYGLGHGYRRVIPLAQPGTCVQNNG